MNQPYYDHISAWKAQELGSKSTVTYTLSDNALRVLDGALRHVQKLDLAVEEITQDHFPVSAILQEINEWEKEIQEGRGLLLLKGINTSRYSKEECAILFWGISTYLGEAQSQSPMGDKLGHVINIGGKDHRERAYRNSLELALHTDASDIVGMMCLVPAEKGGLSGYASGPAIFNHIAQHQPELIPVLQEGFYYHRFGEHLPGESPVSEEKVPVFSEKEGYLSICYLRSYIEMAFEELNVQKTEQETEALDYLDQVAHSEEFRLNFMMEPGEIAFFNNYVVLHTRTEFFDSPDSEKQRHLLRLWLRAHNARPINPVIDAKAQRNGIEKQEGKGTYYKGKTQYTETPPPS
ncbi:MAG: TauD/TfdA family dioxygenase [Gammaproteobacteria bacterium]|nr:TauD/TfdA family dioxygenase [Gammaproteobacteria bacterium]